MADQYMCVDDQAGASFVSETVTLIQTIGQSRQLPPTQYCSPPALWPPACCPVVAVNLFPAHQSPLHLTQISLFYFWNASSSGAQLTRVCVHHQDNSSQTYSELALLQNIRAYVSICHPLTHQSMSAAKT